MIGEISTEARPETEQSRPIAALWHTALVLLIQGLIAYRAFIGAQHMREGMSPDRVHLYERTTFSEWMVLALVLGGVWLHGSSLRTVVGPRWNSAQQVLRDIGLGILFLVITITFSSVLGSGHGSHGVSDSAQFLLPRGSFEMGLWVLLSLSAGICEEVVYRGYLQRQFTALTSNVPAGILLSAAMFGTAHSYQGWQQAVQIGVLGAMGGILAHWCKSVRPGMIAHTLQDLLGGMMRH